MTRVLLLSDKDNIVTFLESGEKGSTISFTHLDEDIEIDVKEKIPFGHKSAIKDIKKGEKIIKYGEVIGRATNDIPKGYHAHTHNIESLRVRFDLVKGDHS